MTDRLYVDIETRSRVDLKKFGVYRYVECPDFGILMSGWRGAGGHTETLESTDHTLDVLTTALRDGQQIAAHNAGFERVCFSKALGMPTGQYLDPEAFHDTAAIAATHGYPRSLDGAARALGATPKDTAGTRLINLFCKPNRKGGWNDKTTHPEQWQEFLAYMVQDVDTLAEVDALLVDFPTEGERAIFMADQHINDRGIRIDRQLAQVAMEAAAANHWEQELLVQHLTGVQNPNSVPQFLKWCQEAISPRIKNLQADTIERLLAHPKLQPHHREVLLLRQELALVASKKFGAALSAVCPDDRLRGTLFYFGAHTGRWSGRGTQVQNLPSLSYTHEDDDTGEVVWDEVGEKTAIVDLLLGNGASAEELKKLVRPMFIGPFTVVDYKSIEAVVLAWWCGEAWVLEAFRAGRDLYIEAAARMGEHYTRKDGKIATLALGFQGAVNSLRAMGAEGTDEELLPLVSGWRRANPAIVRGWADLQSAVGDSADGPVAVGQHVLVTRTGETLRIHLPSGRAITYHGMRWERYRVQDKVTKKWLKKTGWRYDDPKRPGQRIGTYGGRLAENVTQAIARDIMAEGLVRLIAAGYEPVAHVHDEIITDGAHSVPAIKEIMCEPPMWARGLPIDASGFVTERYRKD